jgi:hypothetical protein
VDYYLGGIDSGNGGSAVNLICEWAGTRPSEPFPACAARIGVDLAQR